jgi:hypothetical protein
LFCFFTFFLVGKYLCCFFFFFFLKSIFSYTKIT